MTKIIRFFINPLMALNAKELSYTKPLALFQSGVRFA